jgi:hypothetical protein
MKYVFYIFGNNLLSNTLFYGLTALGLLTQVLWLMGCIDA